MVNVAEYDYSLKTSFEDIVEEFIDYHMINREDVNESLSLLLKDKKIEAQYIYNLKENLSGSPLLLLSNIMNNSILISELTIKKAADEDEYIIKLVEGNFEYLGYLTKDFIMFTNFHNQNLYIKAPLLTFYLSLSTDCKFQINNSESVFKDIETTLNSYITEKINKHKSLIKKIESILKLLEKIKFIITHMTKSDIIDKILNINLLNYDNEIIDEINLISDINFKSLVKEIENINNSNILN